MKKIFSLILALALILSLSACGKEAITMQEIYDASLTDALLENHESIHVKHVVDNQLYEEFYLTKECVFDLLSKEYFEIEDDIEYLFTDNAYYYGTNGDYLRILLISPDGLTDIKNYCAENFASIILSEETALETIESVEKKDNLITVTSVMDQENIKALEMDEGVVSLSCEYLLDEKTHEVVSASSAYAYNEGEVSDTLTEVVYDAQMPEHVNAFVEYVSQTGDMRTITMVFNPGTENEISQSVQVIKGMPVGLVADYASEEEFEMYADAACTELYIDDENSDSDTTIYIKWGE